METHQIDRVLGVGGAAEALGVSESRIRQLIEQGKLRAQRAGRSYAIFESDVLPLLERETAAGRRPLYEVWLDSRISGVGHLVAKGTGEAFCRIQLRSGIVHPVASNPVDLTGVRWCPECRNRAPRHLVRYYSGRGMS